MEWKDLKGKYPVFCYHDFAIIESDTELQVHFDFEIEGLSHFNPEFTLKKPEGSVNAGNLRIVREMAFSLGMIELISYWKLTCSHQVIVECGFLDQKQIAWWKHLYYCGLGEFFYRNHIDLTEENFMDLTAIGERAIGEEDPRTYHGNLIPVGGGKDSFVSLELLKGMKADNDAFVIGQVPSAIHSAEAAGYTGVHLIQAERSLDPRMLEFNKQGYLNGHTPFSALAAFASCLTAVIYGRKYVCLSNEASANESTIHGSKVNHQYSKTFEFEQNFTRYLSRYVTDQVHYFSLLRPLSELQITSIFATLKQYHSVFRSCNVGQKEEKWCGHCAKCLFVCIMLSAFLKDEDLLNIFHADMLNDETMQDLFEQLTGILDDKPFECVGTREEVNVAIAMSIRHHEASGTPLPKLYEYYKGTSYYESFRNRTLDYQMWNCENQVPAEYAELIHEKLNEAQRIWN